jgi:glycosyltransferase involved in cell wall biosynthesis
MKKKFLIFIVAYNAKSTLAKVLERIPDELFEHNELETEVLIIDDCSPDYTFSLGYELQKNFHKCPVRVLRNPKNLGYGGNQKVGYCYAIEKGFDYVALLHGDGQYAPEELIKLVTPLMNEKADVVFGSRMLQGTRALDGGMPLYKFIGNKILTFLENTLVGTSLSEYHSGYRLYSVNALKSVPFERNSNYFDFDTEIIIQMHAAGQKILELPIPTFYGDEICHVNGISYAIKILLACLVYRLQSFGIFYDARFDLAFENSYYGSKFHFLSSHSLALNETNSGDRLLLLGSGPAELVTPFLNKAQTTKAGYIFAIDQYISPELRSICHDSLEADVDSLEFDSLVGSGKNSGFSKIFALDIIEHLRSPEHFLAKLRDAPTTANSTLILTTPNIAFLPIRLMLLLGAFNYGKRGILDRTHTRLFTFRSLQTVLKQQGFDIISMKGIPAPFPLAVGDNILSAILIKLNSLAIKLFRGAFSYQIFVVCRARPTVKQLLNQAFENTSTAIEELEERAAATIH